MSDERTSVALDSEAERSLRVLKEIIDKWLTNKELPIVQWQLYRSRIDRHMMRLTKGKEEVEKRTDEKRKHGRPLTPLPMDAIVAEIQAGVPVAELARRHGISRPTLYRAIENHKPSVENHKPSVENHKPSVENHKPSVPQPAKKNEPHPTIQQADDIIRDGLGQDSALRVKYEALKDSVKRGVRDVIALNLQFGGEKFAQWPPVKMVNSAIDYYLSKSSEPQPAKKKRTTPNN